MLGGIKGTHFSYFFQPSHWVGDIFPFFPSKGLSSTSPRRLSHLSWVERGYQPVFHHHIRYKTHQKPLDCYYARSMLSAFWKPGVFAWSLPKRSPSTKVAKAKCCIFTHHTNIVRMSPCPGAWDTQPLVHQRTLTWSSWSCLVKFQRRRTEGSFPIATSNKGTAKVMWSQPMGECHECLWRCFHGHP